MSVDPALDPSRILVPEVTGETVRGPYQMAQDCRAMIPKLDAAIAAAKTQREAKALRKRRKLCRDLVRWCETRAGYIVPERAKR